MPPRESGSGWPTTPSQARSVSRSRAARGGEAIYSASPSTRRPSGAASADPWWSMHCVGTSAGGWREWS